MKSAKITWKGLIYYGEVFGFLLAWLAVIAVASRDDALTNDPPAFDRVAAMETPALTEGPSSWGGLGR